MFVGLSLAVIAVGLVISLLIPFLVSPSGGFGLVEKSESGFSTSSVE